MKRKLDVELTIRKFVSEFKFKTVLDVGCGDGFAFEYLKGKKISAVDMKPPSYDEVKWPNVEYHQTELMDWTPPVLFDAMLCIHVVEHMPNTELFLKRIMSWVKTGGAWCLAFPPPKERIVGGHVHVFNMGLMLYNLVRIGIDCRKVTMVAKRYTTCIMGVKKEFKVPPLKNGGGDIKTLSKWFPFRARHGFWGNKVPGVIKLKEGSGKSK